MIVVISPEQTKVNEIDTLHRLFDAGLEYFHLRKPNQDEEYYRQYLDKIDSKYYGKIVLHQHHNLVEEYQLKGVHFQEQPRIGLGETLAEIVNEYRTKGFTVSSSFHEPEVLSDCQVDFDYHLLSPVFNSISKQGYQGRGFDVNHINKKIIGMGGVNIDTVEKTIELGFKGIGVLGGVWNTQLPLDSFISMDSLLQKVLNG